MPLQSSTVSVHLGICYRVTLSSYTNNGLFQDIHPLAVENLLQTQEHARSKADYYVKHLFLRVLYHALVSDDPEDASPFHSAVTADQVIPTWDNHPSRRQSSNGAGLASFFGRRRQPEDGLHDQLLTRPSMKSEMSYDGELKVCAPSSLEILA